MHVQAKLLLTKEEIWQEVCHILVELILWWQQHRLVVDQEQQQVKEAEHSNPCMSDSHRFVSNSSDSTKQKKIAMLKCIQDSQTALPEWWGCCPPWPPRLLPRSRASLENQMVGKEECSGRC